MGVGTITKIGEAIQQYGLPGLIVLAVAYVMGKSAKPFFQFLATDRENRRKHTRLMDKRTASVEAKIKTKQKGKKQ